jgi:chromosome segregation ATPase
MVTKEATKEMDKTEELRANVEKAKKTWVQAKKKVSEIRGEIDKYEAKKEQLTIELREAEDVLSNSEEARQKGLQMVVAGETTKAQFSEVKKKHEQTKAEMEDYTSMLDIATDRITELSVEYENATRAAIEKESLFWNYVTQLLIEEVLKNPIAIMACLAYRGHLEPGDFFEDKILKEAVRTGLTEKIKLDLFDQYAK